MRVTDEMVRTAMVKLFSDGVPRTHWHEPVRAALEAALSHAAGQEVDKPAGFGVMCTVAWTELHQMLTADGFDVPGRCGPHTRNWIAKVVTDSPFIAPAVARSEGEG